MSRSYKKTPIINDKGWCKLGKKYANKTVRRYKDIIANGKAYRKIYESYDIHDWVNLVTESEFRKDYESEKKAYLNGGTRYRPSFNFKAEFNNWAKYYYRK